jgi:hypothetical protein
MGRNLSLHFVRIGELTQGASQAVADQVLMISQDYDFQNRILRLNGKPLHTFGTKLLNVCGKMLADEPDYPEYVSKVLNKADFANFAAVAEESIDRAVMVFINHLSDDYAIVTYWSV